MIIRKKHTKEVEEIKETNLLKWVGNRVVTNWKENKKTISATLVSLVLIIVMVLIPTGYESAGGSYRDGEERVSATVIKVDNSNIKDTGLVKTGDQNCQIKLLKGTYKGEIYNAMNSLSGSLEQDKIYEVGDKALVLVSAQNDEVSSVSMIDHYRIDYEIMLMGAFFLFLVLFAGWTGMRAILSFLLTILTIWKILVPVTLNGYNPIIVGGFVAIGLTIMIIALVFGFDKRCLAAVSGSIAGLLITCGVGILSTNLFHIQGAVMSFSESLLYSGYSTLNLTQIFMAGIFIGSAGAMMDLAVDITAAVDEILQKRPDLTRIEAMKSGMQVGKAAMGTMTTTLLLAYSGGYIALLMVFMAQGTPLINVFNYKYVASEIIHTLVGSFGLVSVAPFTSITAGYFLAKGKHKKETASN